MKCRKLCRQAIMLSITIKGHGCRPCPFAVPKFKAGLHGYLPVSRLQTVSVLDLTIQFSG